MVSSSDEDFEKILTNPILDIAARFWDEARYDAFKVCYRSMREIDDMVDHRKVSGTVLSQLELSELKKRIQERVNSISNGHATNELSETIAKFKIPVWPWVSLSKAMKYDLDHNGFSSFRSFLRYCEGAAIAPASVFMHLCGNRISDQNHQPPDFDIRKAARPLAIFSYLVHILRDFHKDQLRRLNYFADDILFKCSLNKEELGKMVRKQSLDVRIQLLFTHYKLIAEYYRKLAWENFKHILPRLAPKYQLSLQVIYALYSHLYDKIDPNTLQLSETDLNLSLSEIEMRLNLTVASFRPV